MRTRFVRLVSYRYRRRAAETLQRCLFVGNGCMSSAKTPGRSAQAHKALRRARVSALIFYMIFPRVDIA
jgi:hypothetical protein